MKLQTKLALAFIAGELWGHAGHGVAWGHVAASLLVSWLCVTWVLKVPWKDLRIRGRDQEMSEALNKWRADL